MYERILVPLDGSELAEVAIPYAHGLANILGSEITLVHVCEEAEAQNHHMHQFYIEKMVEGITHSAEGKAAEVKSAFLVGRPAEQIVDYADKADIGLIVMATHGRSGIKRRVLGNVADKVVRATKRPVALIRAESARPRVSEAHSPRKILVPLDGSKESESVIPYIEGFASKIEGEVVLFHVVISTYPTYGMPGDPVSVPFPQEDMERLKAKARDYLENVASALKGKGINTRAEVGAGTAAEEIIKLADEMGAGLVAMSTHGRSGISRWTFGSTTDKVLRGGNTPLLLVRVSGADTE